MNQNTNVGGGWMLPGKRNAMHPAERKHHCPWKPVESRSGSTSMNFLTSTPLLTFSVIASTLGWCKSKYTSDQLKKHILKFHLGMDSPPPESSRPMIRCCWGGCSANVSGVLVPYGHIHTHIEYEQKRLAKMDKNGQFSIGAASSVLTHNERRAGADMVCRKGVTSSACRKPPSSGTLGSQLLNRRSCSDRRNGKTRRMPAYSSAVLFWGMRIHNEHFWRRW